VAAVLIGALAAGPSAATSVTTSEGIVVGCEPDAVERPYVCDVGEARPLSLQSFQQIFEVDNAVRATVARIGMPNYAELQKVDASDPWVTWEIRTYYLDYNRMFVFGRAMILGSPQVSLLRHEGPIPPDKLAMLTTRTIAVNAAAAADRAEVAAARAEEEAERAERYADGSEAAADGMDRSFRRALVKQ
jgi:hypothetical protein